MTDQTVALPRSRLASAAAVAARHLLPHWSLWLALTILMAFNLTVVLSSPRLSLAPHGALKMAVVCLGVPLLLAYREVRGHAFDRGIEILFRLLMLALFAGLLTQQVNLFSHLAMTLRMPLADARLAAWDAALGHDWNGYIQGVAGSEWSRGLLLFAYSRLIPPVIGIILVAAVALRRLDRVEELAFLTLASGFACVAIAGLLPAEDAWNTLATPQTRSLLGGQPSLDWVEQLKALRGTGPVVLDMDVMEGLATFPSFHACLALIIMWCSRGWWPAALAGSASGLAILAATPVYGGHYAVDLLGALVLMAGLVALWRRIAPVPRSGGARP